MEWLGNVFTHYRYATTDISQMQDGSRYSVRSERSGLFVSVDTATADLPSDSPFSDWKEARRFAGPLPFTFTYKSDTKQVLVVEGVREFWQPQPVSVLDYRVPYLAQLQVTDYRLASAFLVQNIPYHWQKGRLDEWNG